MHPKLLESTVQQCRAYTEAGDCHGAAPPVERLIDAVAQLAEAVPAFDATQPCALTLEGARQLGPVAECPRCKSPPRRCDTDPADAPQRCQHGVRWERRCDTCDTPSLLERLRSSPTFMGCARVRIEDLQAALKLLDAPGVPPTDPARDCPNVKGNPRDGYYCDECASGPCTRGVQAQREAVCEAWHALPDELRKDERLTRLYHALGGPHMHEPDSAGVAVPDGQTKAPKA